LKIVPRSEKGKGNHSATAHTKVKVRLGPLGCQRNETKTSKVGANLIKYKKITSLKKEKGLFPAKRTTFSDRYKGGSPSCKEETKKKKNIGKRKRKCNVGMKDKRIPVKNAGFSHCRTVHRPRGEKEKEVLKSGQKRACVFFEKKGPNGGGGGRPHKNDDSPPLHVGTDEGEGVPQNLSGEACTKKVRSRCEAQQKQNAAQCVFSKRVRHIGEEKIIRGVKCTGGGQARGGVTGMPASLWGSCKGGLPRRSKNVETWRGALSKKEGWVSTRHQIRENHHVKWQRKEGSVN